MYPVVILEKYKMHKLPEGIEVWSQAMSSPKSSLPEYLREAYTEHGYYVSQYRLQGLRTLMTDAEIANNMKIYYMKRNLFALNYANQIGAKTVGLSSLFMDYDVEGTLDYIDHDKGNALEEELSKHMLLFAGAGNDGNEPVNHFEGISATKPAWLGIGAVNPDLVPRGYSSWGNGAVDFCGIDGTIDGRLGTSYATPYVNGIADSYIKKHELLLGFYPTRNHVFEWLKKHSKDLLDAGKDMKTGWGVVVPPKDFKLEVGVYDYTLRPVRKTIRTYTNDSYTEQETDRVIPAHWDLDHVSAWHDKANKVAYYSHMI